MSAFPDKKKNPAIPSKRPPQKREGLLRRCYKKLSSVRTSIYLLGLMALFYVVGTIFPQGEELGEYIKAGGKLVPLVRLLGLLDLFSSPLFVVLALIFLLNLIICSYERYRSLKAKRVFPDTFEPTHSFALTHDLAEARIEVRRALREDLGFKLLSKEIPWTVMERGVPYRWLTWLYHAGIIVCFAGFLTTYLFAFEDSVTLKPDKPQTITPEAGGRLKKLFGSKIRPTEFQLLQEEFSTEYVQSPNLNYPDDKISRLAVGLGWKGPAYELKEDSLAVKGWKAKVRVVNGKKNLLNKTVEVNDPLRYGGYTFYLVDYEQNVKVRVGDNPILLEGKADEELIVPGIEAPLKFEKLKTGVVYRLDNAIENLKPYTVVKRVSKTKGQKEGGKEEELGKMEVGGSIEIDGRRITFVDFDEAPVLNYRYDPGVPPLWFGGIFVLALMCGRFYGGWCMIAYEIEEKKSIVYLNLYISTKGLGADGEKVAKKIEHCLTRHDIKPTPLPSEK